ncbi:hypothetical protein C4901_01265 [Acidiferrobacter sp. SPIII_3]|uniref:hypothetical protein n=1 Tax=Acidiferrobacter sp. SPIII_3 TaxID=1281578 RepID=UPI000D72ADAA|nr:hypothetical protein [Acidiferrobacter sp. SPIII_3]AWP22148.1 hypothetical protein C4901_01265 [Acidiferrobacter sp. SPIII_3]
MTRLPILPLLLAVHVLSVILWIGGLAFVTTVVLPALVRLPAAQRIPAFLEIERRFGLQARVLVLVVGASGGYMLMRLHLAGLMAGAHGLWLDGMVAFWALFMLLLFVLEPAVLHRHLRERGARDGEATRALLLRGHAVLLVLALIVVTAAVLGVQGVG